MPIDLAAYGKGGWNGAVEDTTTAIAAGLGQVGARLKQLRQPAEILSMFGSQGEGGALARARTVGKEGFRGMRMA